MKKRMIVCCDGTWNDLEMRYITNVGRLVQALLPAGRTQNNGTIAQTVYYDDGVGADAGGMQRFMQGGFGWGIDNLIYEAYRHICINHQEGDELCLFGFSRGAFTARSVAGMIERVGLVPRSELKYVPAALTAYRTRDKEKQKDFMKQANSRKVDVDLLGCWDTVGALGMPDKIPFLSIDEWSRKKYQFHDTTLGSCVKRAIHAVAIDDQRNEFKPTLMNRKNNNQKLVQKWFPGDHGSVGGGSWSKRGLSNHCLKWMITQARDLGVNIGVDWSLLHDQAISDHSIFFQPTMNMIYRRRDRDIPKEVKWTDIDDSARHRWLENPAWRPRKLKQRFGDRLDNLPSDGLRHTPTSLTRLAKNASADLHVQSRAKSNRSYIEVIKGEQYEVEVSPLQVWKDGNLDPCGVLGWNLEHEGANAKLPWEDGHPVDLNALKESLIRRANSRKLVVDADWFELVAGVGGKEYSRLPFKKPADEITPFRALFKAPADGELYFAANDLSSRIDFIDKYDNNVGAVWIRIKRTV